MDDQAIFYGLQHNIYYLNQIVNNRMKRTAAAAIKTIWILGRGSQPNNLKSVTEIDFDNESLIL